MVLWRVPRALSNISRELADAAVAIALAPLCAACREPLDHPTRGVVCDGCWRAIEPLAPPPREPLPPGIAVASALGLYDGRLRDIVQALKYDARSTIAAHLARRLSAAAGGLLAGADLAVPVPLHRSRERTRGFNQARELARHLPLPLADVLIRTRHTDAQADLPAARRAANVRGAFALRRRAAVDGRVVVLIDDVCTTGATLNACAAVLLDAGAAEVRALTAARAVLKSDGRPR
jgi:ComF family protein